MATITAHLPRRHPNLVIREMDERNRFVVKHPGTGDFFEIGEQEHFLLTRLDGAADRDALSREFESRFSQTLTTSDLDEFIDVAEQQGLLCESGMEQRRTSGRQSLLNWRKRLLDPDRFFTWLEPRIRFFWTPGFVALSALSIGLAICLLWVSRQNLLQSFNSSLHLESILIAWMSLLVVITLHEFAHGLTCKHFGGQVNEIGFLLLFFMPCFYCNVSDAWLFPEKSKRLWVTFAGGFFELFVWSLAVFAWELTVPGSLVNHVAFIVVSLCGIQSLFNFLPLIKLDGYYLLSDWLEIPNLRQRALDRWKISLRHILWGAPIPAPESDHRLLTLFGLASWTFSLVFVCLMLVSLGSWMGHRFGPAGVAWIALPGVILVSRMFRGVTGGEVAQMLRLRGWRTTMWLLALAVSGSALCFWEIEDRAGGEFQLRSTVRAEVRAPVAGFLREICVAEGQPVPRGACVLRLEIPDLTSEIAQKKAELQEAQAGLSQLEAGTRPEELRAQRNRIESARAWRDVAQKDLDHSRAALERQLESSDTENDRARAELDAAQEHFNRTKLLQANSASSAKDFETAQLRMRTAQAASLKAVADRRALESRGVLLVELELAEREHELASLQSTLTVMEAGSRLEAIQGQRSRVERLREQVRQLEGRQEQLVVCTPVGGFVTTPHYREKIGSYFQTGELILLVEDPSSLEAEIRVDEQALKRVRDGQDVTLRPRSLPLEKVLGKVDRVANAADPPDASRSVSHVTIECSLGTSAEALRPGMSGFARINTGKRPVGAILTDRVLRNLKTEYWW